MARLPEIPAKKGYSAAWPDLDYSHLTASQTLEAIYTPYTSSLTDGGDLPDILVDGSFSAQAKVSHTTKETAWTDSKGESHQGTAYTVTVKDPVLDARLLHVHCRLPEANGRYAVWVQTGENWQRQDSEKDGSYLLFPSTGETHHLLLGRGGESSGQIPSDLHRSGRRPFYSVLAKKDAKEKRTRTAAPSQQP